MTNKSPVYHRTIDGRKVVIVGKSQDDLCVCFYDTALGYLYVKPEHLTPWVEPEMTSDKKIHGTVKIAKPITLDMAEEQKAWDGFAGAALTGLLAKDGCYGQVIKDATHYADAMMEQRKARM